MKTLKQLFSLAMVLLAAGGSLATPVQFPIRQMFGTGNYTRPFTVTAVASSLTDNTNLFIGSTTNVVPTGGTNPIVALTPNNYVVTFSDSRTPWRIAVPNTTSVQSALLLTVGTLPTFSYVPIEPPYTNTPAPAGQISGRGIGTNLAGVQPFSTNLVDWSKLGTNGVGTKYTNSTGLVAVIDGNGIGTNTAHLDPAGAAASVSNYYHGMSSNGAWEINLQSGYSLPLTGILGGGNLLTNKWVGGPVSIDANNRWTNTYGGKLSVMGGRVQNLYSSADGAGSVAFGNGSRATGNGSVVLGYSAVASGLYGFALNGGLADGSWSSAIGPFSQATNDYAFVWSSVPTYVPNGVDNDGNPMYDAYPIGSESNGTFTVSAPAFRFLNGIIYGDGSGLSGVDLAGTAWAAATAVTNGYPWSALYDPAGAAQAATNALGTAAYSMIESFDPAGAAQSATNALGSAAWKSAGSFDTNGAAAAAAQAATNALGTGAFNPKYVLPAYVLTNSSAFASSSVTNLTPAQIQIISLALTNSAAFAAAGVTNLTASQLNTINLAITNSAGFDTNGAWKLGTNAANLTGTSTNLAQEFTLSGLTISNIVDFSKPVFLITNSVTLTGVTNLPPTGRFKCVLANVYGSNINVYWPAAWNRMNTNYLMMENAFIAFTATVMYGQTNISACWYQP